MTQQTVTAPDNADRVPARSDSNEFGDSWKEAVDKVNLNFTELYETNPAGSGTATFAPSGSMSVSVTQIGSSATNTTQTLKTYSMPANTLSEDGAGIEVWAWGTKPNNAAPVVLELDVGGAVMNLASSAGANYSWEIKGRVYRRGSNVQRASFDAIRGAVPQVSSTGDTSTDSGAITIAVKGLDASAAQSNIICDGLVVNYLKAP